MTKRSIVPLALVGLLGGLAAPASRAGIHDISFRSELNGRDVNLKVYTPPGYEDGDGRYPVVYNLHGAGGGSPERQWERTEPTIAAAIGGGEVRPMIYVFVDGLGDTFFIDYADGTPRVASMIVEELIPWVDARYRTIASKEGRAIDGFSMGGYGCLMLAFKHPDLFGSVVSYGAALIRPDRVEGDRAARWGSKEHSDRFNPWALARANREAIRDGLRVRMVCGVDDGLYPANLEFKQLLEELEIPVSWVPVEGVAHDTRGLYRRVGLESLEFIERGLPGAAEAAAGEPSAAVGPGPQPR